MNLRNLAAITSVVALGACGSDTTVHTISSGTYRVTDARAVGTDGCGILAAYTDPAKVIGVSVSGTKVTFNPANDPSAPVNSLPTATVNGNDLVADPEVSYVVGPFGTNCNLRIRRTMGGSLVANDTAQLTLSFSSAPESGTCTGVTLPFTSATCSSSYAFVATKQ